MLNKLVIGVCLALALAACASSSATRAVKPLAFTPSLAPVGCAPDSATRIPLRPHECLGTGHVYSHSELERTGALTTSEALGLLDPSLIVHGH